MKQNYPKPYNIRIPQELELNEAQEERFRELEHSRQKYESKRMYKDRRER